MKKLIAYRTKDIEGDVWSETVFVFKNEENVKSFFNSENKDLIEIFTDEDNRTINDFEIHGLNGNINSISFNTEYAGDVNIYEMSAGYIV